MNLCLFDQRGRLCPARGPFWTWRWALWLRLAYKAFVDVFSDHLELSPSWPYCDCLRGFTSHYSSSYRNKAPWEMVSFEAFYETKDTVSTGWGEATGTCFSPQENVAMIKPSWPVPAGWVSAGPTEGPSVALRVRALHAAPLWGPELFHFSHCQPPSLPPPFPPWPSHLPPASPVSLTPLPRVSFSPLPLGLRFSEVSLRSKVVTLNSCFSNHPHVTGYLLRGGFP